MGTWGGGPFKNDVALDFVADIMDRLVEPVNAFMADPQIDETFDPAFAAIALINAVMAITPSQPWNRETKQPMDGNPIREAMLACFDGHIDELEPDLDYKRDHRAALVATLDELVAKTTRQA